MHIPARFPDAYIPDVHLRLTMYKRIASANTLEELNELQVETIDRFGLLPDAAKNLFSIAELKLNATACDIRSLDIGQSGGRIKFVSNPNINIDKLMRAIASNPLEFRFVGAEAIQVMREMPSSTERFAMVNEVFDLVRND